MHSSLICGTYVCRQELKSTRFVYVLAEGAGLWQEGFFLVCQSCLRLDVITPKAKLCAGLSGKLHVLNQVKEGMSWLFFLPCTGLHV